MKDSAGKIQIMGILNVTPDSFSDGGTLHSHEEAVERAMTMVRDGADIIDIGGESTRPGFTPVSVEEELDRVLPVIRGIREKSDIPISVDTTKYEVACEAIDAGATMINDIWGLKKDDRLGILAAKTGVGICLMQNRENPVSETAATKDEFREALMDTVCEELSESVSIARECGIADEQILLDPGIGFGKTYGQNLIVIRHVDRIVSLGFPVLMAASRKSVIGHTLGLPVDEREEGTIAISVYAAMKGCKMVRVHDVAKNKRALSMLEAIL